MNDVPCGIFQSLREALRYDGDIRNDKHILSFSLYELGMLQLSRSEVRLAVADAC